MIPVRALLSRPDLGLKSFVVSTGYGIGCQDLIVVRSTASPLNLRGAILHQRSAWVRVNYSLILTSNRAPVDWYLLFPNPVVAESYSTD